MTARLLGDSVRAAAVDIAAGIIGGSDGPGPDRASSPEAG